MAVKRKGDAEQDCLEEGEDSSFVFSRHADTGHAVPTSLLGSCREAVDAILEDLGIGDAPDTPSGDLFSTNLKKIRRMGAKQEATLWTGLAKIMDPEKHQFYPDFVKNDYLRRNFDATSETLGYLFDSVAEGQGKQKRISLDGICKIACNHFGFFHFPDAETGYSPRLDKTPRRRHSTILEFCKELDQHIDNPNLQYLRQLTDMPCTKLSFEHIIRCLRVGKLLAMIQESAYSSSATLSGMDELYYIDYDVNDISGSFVPSTRTKQIRGRRHKYTVPVVNAQKPMGSGAHVMSFEEYLFTDHLSATRDAAGVHWMHAHNPGNKVVLALAQHFSLPPSTMDRLTHLYDARPVLHFNPVQTKSEEEQKESDATLEERLRMNCAVDDMLGWAVMVLPAVHVTGTSREDLGAFSNWYWSRDLGRHGSDEGPPKVRVGAIISNLALVWASTDWSIVLTVCSEPTYLGKWITDDESHEVLTVSRLFGRLCEGCKSWFRKPNGYQPLRQDDPDDLETPRTEEEGDETVLFAPKSEEVVGYVVPQNEQHCASFERSFNQVLMQLGEPNALLRTGSDVQLVTRIVLNRTREYLDVVNLYKAALARLQHMMKDRDRRNKDSLIANVALARKELLYLDRVIRPVITEVLPEFHQAVESGEDKKIVQDQMKEMDHMLSQFGPACQSQIETCDHMIDEYDRAASDKTNSMLTILTVITFVIIPLQLLSGIYGMNFKGMPELQWGAGYNYFWVLAGSLTFLFAIILSVIHRYGT
jgi:Mg2+ and Co2+ transporter CorA